MRSLLVCLSCVAACVVCGGCYHQPYQTPERMSTGLVVVLPGIEGRSPLNEGVVQGLVDGGVPYGIDLERWTSWLGPLYNLRAELHNRRKATQIAVHVAEYKYAHPDKPVILVGQSGGGAMALWIAEAMPEGQEIDGIILLAPAISPGYMVDFALCKTKRGIVNFYSSRDWLFLGVGTTIIGTMDGKHSSSAGRVGFTVPAKPGRSKVYDKLYQIAWHQQMAMADNTGTHLTSSAEAFVANYVAPLALSRAWSDELIAKILSGQKIDYGKLPPMDQWRPQPGRDWPPGHRPGQAAPKQP